MAASEAGSSGMKIEMYKLANRLKARMGIRFKEQDDGFLAPESIEEADKLIAALSAECPQMIASHLEKLSALWAQMKSMEDSPARTDISQQIFTLAHEVKDMGSMSGYELLSYFAESLRDYIGRTDLNMKAQVVIIQAHMDAMMIVNRSGVKSDAGPQAEELKKMVKIAIDKYH